MFLINDFSSDFITNGVWWTSFIVQWRFYDERISSSSRPSIIGFFTDAACKIIQASAQLFATRIGDHGNNWYIKYFNVHGNLDICEFDKLITPAIPWNILNAHNFYGATIDNYPCTQQLHNFMLVLNL